MRTMLLNISQGENLQNPAEPLQKTSHRDICIFGILRTLVKHFWMITLNLGSGNFFYSHIFKMAATRVNRKQRVAYLSK